MSLDQYIQRPEEMVSYLSNYGWHFNKKAVKLAVSHMRKKNASTEKMERIENQDRDQVDEMMTKYGIVLDNNKGYDYIYVYHMGMADFLHSSIIDEQHLCMYVKDVIDDPDACDGMIFRRWYSDMIAKGVPIDWADLI